MHKITAEYLNTKKIIAERLMGAGCELVKDFDMQYTYAVARKSYQTAVGIKEASLALEPLCDGSLQLVGNYLSEGNNVLSTTWFSIPQGLSEARIVAGTERFAAAVDKKVDQSYARRLWLPE